MNQNGKHGNLAAVDVLDEEPQTESTAYYDSNSPLLKPAREEDKSKTRSWKRRLVGWSFVLLLIAGGAIALYLLLRVNRVNVKVQADSPRDLQKTKAKDDATKSENDLTADAINTVRAATGIDNTTSHNPNATASPNASPKPSPKLQFNNGPSLGFTGNNSPVNEKFGENNSGNGNQQQNADKTQSQQKSGELSLAAVNQSHANATQSIFVDDSQGKATTAQLSLTPVSARIDKTTPSFTSKPAAPVLPPFGTMLPVRTQGVIFTLRNNSYARLELTRDCGGAGWSLPKGTILVGRTSGSEADRAFVNVLGYIDPRDNRLVKMTGDLLGSDGASGISGKRISVDNNRLKQTLRKVALSGVQIAGTMAGALTGHGTVVIDSAGYRLMSPITDDARNALGGGSQKNSFVKVEAGRAAYVMVADLPKSRSGVDAPGDDELAQAARSLSDREVMELVLFGTPEEIRAAVSLMTEDQKRMAMKAMENNQR
jgi:hypothetical protein